MAKITDSSQYVAPPQYPGDGAESAPIHAMDVLSGINQMLGGPQVTPAPQTNNNTQLTPDPVQALRQMRSVEPTLIRSVADWERAYQAAQLRRIHWLAVFIAPLLAVGLMSISLVVGYTFGRSANKPPEIVKPIHLHMPPNAHRL
jgi:hypothetical protein